MKSNWAEAQCTVILMFYIFSVISPSIEWLIFLRFMIGLAVGSMPQVITYMVEFTPSNTKYNITTLVAVIFNVGASMGVLQAMFIYPTQGWRWWVLSCTLPAVICVLLTCWMPESPEFDMSHGNRTRTMKTLRCIERMNRKTLPEGQLVADKYIVSEKSGTIRDLLELEYLIITAFGGGMFFCVSFCYYGTTIFIPSIISNFDSQHFDESSNSTLTAHNIQDSCELDKYCEPYTQSDYTYILLTTVPTIIIYILMFFFVNRIDMRKSVGYGFILFGLMTIVIPFIPSKETISIILMISRGVIATVYFVIYMYIIDFYPVHIRAIGIGVSDTIGLMGSIVTPFFAQLLMSYSILCALIVYSVLSIIPGVVALCCAPAKKTKKFPCDGDTFDHQ